MSEDDSADTSDLQQQITTVTTTLTTVLQEKSKMEANYQAEKKKLRVRESLFIVDGQISVLVLFVKHVNFMHKPISYCAISDTAPMM